MGSKNIKREEIARKLTKEDFKGTPITEEPDGDYQVVEVNGTFYYRNVETGKIDY